MLEFLDKFFLVFHTLFTVFNMTGWMFYPLKKIHFAAVTATAFSWFVLGIWYGFGFCFCTEWHWQIRERLGRPVDSDSYIHFLIREISGIDLNPVYVDISVGICFFFAAVMSVYVNFLKKNLNSVQRD